MLRLPITDHEPLLRVQDGPLLTAGVWRGGAGCFTSGIQAVLRLGADRGGTGVFPTELSGLLFVLQLSLACRLEEQLA